MRFSPILLFHIWAGAFALLSGSAALSFRKGSQHHRLAGSVFVISMLGLASTGAYLGFTKHQTLNGLMGVLTFYLVITAWWTARRRDRETGIFDWGALLVPLAVGISLLTNGLEAASSQTGSKGGDPAAAYFIFGSVALLFAAGDVRMLVSGGVFGAQRVARHLRRMCFGLFIATGSFFLGGQPGSLRQQILPASLRKTGILFFLAILPLILMVFWLFRVLYTNKGRAAFGRQMTFPGGQQ